MSYQSDSSSVPSAVQRVAYALRQIGWICFWTQLVLGVVSGIILLFALLIASQTPATRGGSPGIGGGLFFAIAGIGVLGFSTYQAFRYTRLGRQLRAPGSARPSRAETVKQMRVGLLSNMVGMLITLIGAEAINGILLAKAVSQPQSLLQATVNIREFIQPLDLFVVLANTHTIVAHFAGIVAAIWLLNQAFKN